MPKKKSKREHPTKHKAHPIFRQELSLGERAADKIAKFGGSWTFILLFIVFLFGWMGVQSWLLLNKSFDPFPFILLNLTLSCLAAIQAPVILMATNRQASREHIDANYDHIINRKAEREIQQMQKELRTIHNHILHIKKGKKK
ncbi:MAG: hypothetical protein CMH61_02290 [Nanoarchaeota archaeon]|nr:hypothetical protein [Nanoarchaeota archaeon]|tara:strand:- start:753 stop:1181 length:429 start_codon:yes stop_codon:yes gene_type:complete